MGDEPMKQVHEVRITGNDWPDYVVRSWPINDVVMGVEAFECVGDSGEGTDVRVFLRKGWTSFHEETTNLDEAEVFVEGSIKWDGCSNLTHGVDGRCIHSCSREEAMKIGALIGRLYDIARDMMGDRCIFE
jgi:hypothetical protein